MSFVRLMPMAEPGHPHVDNRLLSTSLNLTKCLLIALPDGIPFGLAVALCSHDLSLSRIRPAYDTLGGRRLRNGRAATDRHRICSQNRMCNNERKTTKKTET